MHGADALTCVSQIQVCSTDRHMPSVGVWPWRHSEGWGQGPAPAGRRGWWAEGLGAKPPESGAGCPSVRVGGTCGSREPRPATRGQHRRSREGRWPGRDAGPGRRPRRMPRSKAPSASVRRALPRPCRGPRVGGTGASTAGQPGTGQASREAAALPGPCALSRGLPDPVPHFLSPGHGSVICSQLPLSVVPLGWLLMCPTGKNLRPWGPPPRHRGK